MTSDNEVDLTAGGLQRFHIEDGTLLLNWFTLQKNQIAVLLARSTDNGRTWSEPVQLKLDSPYSFACSAPVRQLPDDSLILGLYCEDDKTKPRVQQYKIFADAPIARPRG